MSLKENTDNNKMLILFSFAIDFFLVGLLLYKGVIIGPNKGFATALAILFIFIAYVLSIRVAYGLKKKEINGITRIIWASFMLFIISQNFNFEEISFFMFILNVLLLLFYVYIICSGMIRLILSVNCYLRKEGKDKIESVEIIFGIVTAIIAIIISLV